ncbi:hypothetical protein [Clostridium sp. Marseille-Q7071]
MSEVLNAINISKTYGNQRVLDNVNISIEEGEIIGIVKWCGKNYFNENYYRTNS